MILTKLSQMRYHCLMRIEKQAVLDAATRLLAVNPGASTREIAQAASISRASLHRLFPTRDALVEEIAVRAVEQLTAAITDARLSDGPALEAIARLTDAVVPLVHQFAFLATEMQVHQSEHLHRVDRDVDELFLQLFRRGQQEGTLRQDLPAIWLVRAYDGLLYGVAVATQQGDVAPRDASRLVLSTFVRGAASQPATINELGLQHRKT